MKDSKSNDIQSPLNDQEKGVGFVLVKNAVMKNAKGNYHSFSKEKAAPTSDGSNFTFLGIVIILALMKFGPEIMANLNGKPQMSDAFQKQVMARQAAKKNRSKNDGFSTSNMDWDKILVNKSSVFKRPVPDNDSQLLNQSNQNERLSATLKKQNQDIKNAIKEQNEILEYLEGRENNRQVRERLKIFGNFLLNLRL
jgi:hypothetical protein